MTKPNNITVSRSKRGTSVKARGFAAKLLFDALTANFVQQDDPGQAVYTIHFEDHGQDFLEWDVDGAGLVVGSRPYQAGIWCGCKVIGTPHPGKLVVIQRARAADASINYPVLKLTLVMSAPTPT